MPPRWEQLQALRAPPEMKAARGAEYDYHLLSNTLAYLESIKPTKELAFGDDKAAPNPLNVLDPNLDTLPYLFTLGAQISLATGKAKSSIDSIRPGDPLWQNIILFLSHFDPVEIRYAGSQWRKLVEFACFTARIATPSESSSVLSQVANAMLRLDPSAGTLTSTHRTFLQTCLDTRAYQPGLLILEKDIHSIGPKSPNLADGQFYCSVHNLSNSFISQKSGFTEKLDFHDVLEYYLLGAMVYIGLRNWTLAIFYLEHVLTAPANNAANGPMLEAYKKWVLVSLLVAGRLSSLPKAASSGSMKVLKAAARPYESLADAFGKANSDKLRAEAYEAHQVWVDDGNSGLVNQVIDHHRKLFVCTFQNIYAAMPVTTLSSKLGMPPAETEIYLNSLISDGLLNASVERSLDPGQPTILKFSHNMTSGPLAKTEDQSRQVIIAQTNRIKELADYVNEADRRLSLTKEYVDYVRRFKRNREDRVDAEEEPMDLSYAPAAQSGEDDDENVMADVG